MNLLDVHYLLASLVWGSVGTGYCIYAKRQQSIIPFVAGVLMIAASFLITSALLMSVACLALMFLVYYLVRRGY